MSSAKKSNSSAIQSNGSELKVQGGKIEKKTTDWNELIPGTVGHFYYLIYIIGNRLIAKINLQNYLQFYFFYLFSNVISRLRQVVSARENESTITTSITKSW